jgi:PAS domain-containing protein
MTTPVLLSNRVDLISLQSHLHARRTTIITAWSAAMISTGLIHPTSAARSHFAFLLDQIIAILLTESGDRAMAERIGAAFADLLGGTLEVLGCELLADLPVDTVVALQPRLVVLLGTLATGWARRVQERASTTVAPLPGAPAPERLEPHSTASYRMLVEGIPAITYIAAFDDASSTIYTSPQIETILGFSQAEWMADDSLWLKQIHPDDRAHTEGSRAHSCRRTTCAL